MLSPTSVTRPGAGTYGLNRGIRKDDPQRESLSNKLRGKKSRLTTTRRNRPNIESLATPAGNNSERPVSAVYHEIADYIQTDPAESTNDDANYQSLDDMDVPFPMLPGSTLSPPTSPMQAQPPRLSENGQNTIRRRKLASRALPPVPLDEQDELKPKRNISNHVAPRHQSTAHPSARGTPNPHAQVRKVNAFNMRSISTPPDEDDGVVSPLHLHAMQESINVPRANSAPASREYQTGPVARAPTVPRRTRSPRHFINSKFFPEGKTSIHEE
eukprot:m.231952 g.231952  ORF g.231952 m.231952 type:complete len:271 (-) comp16014_c0_seq5:3142-3954(-)